MNEAIENIVGGLVSKVGISKEQAEQVLTYLREHSDEVLKWLQESSVAQSVKDKLPGGLGKLF